MTRVGGLSKIRALARKLAKEEETAETNRRQAQNLARKGRGGDSEIAHVTPGEIVIPQALQTPEVMDALAWAASSAGLNLDRLRIGARANSINPKTGAPEFSGTLDEDYILPVGDPWKNPPYAGGLPEIAVIGQRQIPGPFPMPEIPVPGRRIDPLPPNGWFNGRPIPRTPLPPMPKFQDTAPPDNQKILEQLQELWRRRNIQGPDKGPDGFNPFDIGPGPLREEDM